MASVYIGVILIGLLHGIEPSHGWPVAVLFSLRKKEKMLYGLITSSILAFFHFVSSIAVVLLFLFLNKTLSLSSLPFVRYVAAGVLFFMAYRAFNEKIEDSCEKSVKTLWQMATFAFVLGFVHEEEFALLALCLNNINCLLLMVTYASSVSIVLILLTLISIKSYTKVEKQIKRYEKYIPKIIALVLAGLGVLYLIRVF